LKIGLTVAKGNRFHNKVIIVLLTAYGLKLTAVFL